MTAEPVGNGLSEQAWESYEVIASEREMRRQHAPLMWGLRVTGPALFVLALVMYLAPASPPAWVFHVAAPLCLVALALFSLWGALLTFEPSITHVDTGPSGLRVRANDRVIRGISWSTNAEVRMSDHRGLEDTLSRVPCILTLGWHSYGLSSEAADGVLRAAQKADCVVIPPASQAPSSPRLWLIRNSPP